MNFTNENNLIENEECTIFYSGDLYQKKSDRVFIVYGFGNNWEHTSEKEMLKQENGFLAKIRMLQYNNIHFCFRNSNYEWDNNNSANYTLPILEADKSTSPKTNTENIKTESNDKNELLNNILEESNVELDYVQEFDIDNLIEEILSPLLEETLYSFDESEVPETKINESVTTLLNNELNTSKDQTFDVSEDLNTVITPSDSSEFSMSTLIEDLKKDIIETSSILTNNDDDIASTSNTEIISNTVKEETTSLEITKETSNNTDTTEDISAMLNDTTVSISSSIVDEILEDITQMFASMDFDTNIVEEVIESGFDVTEQTANSIDTNTIIENTEEQNDTNNDDDDDSNTNITTLNISDSNDDSLDIDIIEDIDDTDIEETEEDTSLDSSSETDSEESVAACTALTVRNEDRFVICSRKLTKFYMIRKKIKLALYKIFFAIPRMIKREFNTNKNQD